MKTTYVRLKSELSQLMHLAENDGADCYRTRMQCNCPPCQNRRDGIIVIRGEQVVGRVVRCKVCASFSL